MPVAAKTDLFRDQPFARLLHGRMIFRNAGFTQADRGNRRVPHRRKAGLDANVIRRLVLQPFQFTSGADDGRMIVRIAERFQRDERIEHRGENRGQTVRPFEAFEHPLLGLLERAFAEGVNVVLRKPLGELVQLVEPDEKIAQGESLRVGGQRQVALVVALRVQLAECDVVRRARRLEMIDDRQRHEHRPRPGTQLPEIEVKPFSDEDDFARDRRHVSPRE